MIEYIERFYRKQMKPDDLVGFAVKIKESDLMIYADLDLNQIAYEILERERNNLEAYIRYQPDFKKSLNPIAIADFAPPICKLMKDASLKAGVGPMAAVAGAINDRLAPSLLVKSSELIIENGGDLLIHSKRERTVAIYAGERSSFSSELGLIISPGKTWGIATSSKQVGPSLSFGQADSVTVIAESSSYADAWATSIGNMVRTRNDVEKVLNHCDNIFDINGVVIVFEDILGVRGDIRFVSL